MAKWFEKSEREGEIAFLLLDKGYYLVSRFHSQKAVKLKLNYYAQDVK